MKNYNLKLKILTISFFILLGFFGLPKISWAATINAASCSRADVESAISAAASGDTVVIPAGACSWDSHVNIPLGKNIAIQGQTTTSRNASTYQVTVTDKTIIQKSGFNVAATSNVRITGITFDGNVAGAMTQPIVLPRSPVNMRIDHNHFTHYARTWHKGGGGGYLNVLFDNNRITQPGEESLYIVGKGNTSWSDGGTCGADAPEKTTWIEDNEWILDTANGTNFMDMGEGARVVLRNNRFTGNPNYFWTTALVEAHGHCQSFRDGDDNAGTYCLEISGNEVHNEKNPDFMGQSLVQPRGGKTYVYNNNMYNTGWHPYHLVHFYVEESVYNCNSTVECAVQAHEDAGYHAVPLKTDPATPPYDTVGLCNTYPCPMQVNNSYVWGNTWDIKGESFLYGVESTAVYALEDRDWWDDAGAGDTNFTKDVAANRPGTCTIGDVYWETNTKKLYRCTATNIWTFIYSPYTYPHPLRAEVPPPPDTTPPAAPSGVTIL